MSKVRTGDVLSCEVCGLSVIVDEDCGCAITEIICCEEPMVNMGQIAPKNKSELLWRQRKKQPRKKQNRLLKRKSPKNLLKKTAKKPVPKKKVAKK